MRTILIVDDSSTARMVIQRCLEVIGVSDCEFVQAPNGKEALDILRARPVHLLITDVNMPIMDGKKLLLNVKASPKLNSTPVCVVTSLGNPALEQELKKIGAESVINKPVSPEKLKGAFEQIFGKDGVL